MTMSSLLRGEAFLPAVSRATGANEAIAFWNGLRRPRHSGHSGV